MVLGVGVVRPVAGRGDGGAGVGGVGVIHPVAVAEQCNSKKFQNSGE